MQNAPAMLGQKMMNRQAPYGPIGMVSQNMSGNKKGGGAAPVAPIVSGSISLNGTGQYASVITPASTLINWYTGNFTIEYWIKPNSFISGANSESTVIGNLDPTTATAGTYWSFGPVTGGTVKFYYFNGSAQSFSTVVTIPTGTWTHLAFVNNLGTLTIYVNGISRASAAYIATAQSSNTLPLSIGKANAFSFNGLLTNIRLSTSAVYTSNFTVPISPLTSNVNTSILLLASTSPELLTDSSANGVTVANSGGVTWNASSPFIP